MFLLLRMFFSTFNTCVDMVCPLQKNLVDRWITPGPRPNLHVTMMPASTSNRLDRYKPPMPCMVLKVGEEKCTSAAVDDRLSGPIPCQFLSAKSSEARVNFDTPWMFHIQQRFIMLPLD